MMRRYPFAIATALLAAGLVLVGCSSTTTPTSEAGPPKDPPKLDEVAAERARLSPGDRALVEAQEWCVVSSDERLGSMGPPMKLDIQGQSVFICCKGCKKRAEAEPDRTLARVEELKRKKLTTENTENTEKNKEKK